VALRSPLSALGALITITAVGWLATPSCSTGYVLTDGAYAGNNGGMGGSNIPPNDGGTPDSGIVDAGMDDGGLSDGGCQPQTSTTGCFSIGQPCFPSAGYLNGGCSISLVCYSYVDDAGVSQSTCCQLMMDGTYLCQP
jgi:hypothetical protein